MITRDLTSAYTRGMHPVIRFRSNKNNSCVKHIKINRQLYSFACLIFAILYIQHASSAMLTHAYEFEIELQQQQQHNSRNLGVEQYDHYLKTTFVGGIGQSGNMFDIVTYGKPITIHTFSIHTVTNSDEYFEIWTKDDSINLSKSNPHVYQTDGWYMFGCGTVTGLGLFIRTDLPAAGITPLYIPPASTQGLYLTFVNPGAFLQYTEGSELGKIYTSNTNLAILEGIGITYPFLTVFFDRVWNGIVYYSVSDMRSRDLYNIFDDNNFDTPMNDRHLQKVSIDCRPSSLPTRIPTPSPTSVPTKNPTDHPTRKPSQRPTFHPTTKPSQNPSRKPSLKPSLNPSSYPTNHLSFLPSRIPSVKPTESPSKFPTTKPSKSPSSSPVVLVSEITTIFKSKIPSSQPTIYYEYKPSSLPSITDFPSNLLSSPLSNAPSEIDVIATNGVSEEPTISPAINPTIKSPILESFHPSSAPSINENLQPSNSPTSLNSGGIISAVVGAVAGAATAAGSASSSAAAASSATSSAAASGSAGAAGASGSAAASGATSSSATAAATANPVNQLGSMNLLDVDEVQKDTAERRDKVKNQQSETRVQSNVNNLEYRARANTASSWNVGFGILKMRDTISAISRSTSGNSHSSRSGSRSNDDENSDRKNLSLSGKDVFVSSNVVSTSINLQDPTKLDKRDLSKLPKFQEVSDITLYSDSKSPSKNNTPSESLSQSQNITPYASRFGSLRMIEEGDSHSEDSNDVNQIRSTWWQLKADEIKRLKEQQTLTKASLILAANQRKSWWEERAESLQVTPHTSLPGSSRKITENDSTLQQNDDEGEDNSRKINLNQLQVLTEASNILTTDKRKSWWEESTKSLEKSPSNSQQESLRMLAISKQDQDDDWFLAKAKEVKELKQQQILTEASMLLFSGKRKSWWEDSASKLSTQDVCQDEDNDNINDIDNIESKKPDPIELATLPSSSQENEQCQVPGRDISYNHTDFIETLQERVSTLKASKAATNVTENNILSTINFNKWWKLKALELRATANKVLDDPWSSDEEDEETGYGLCA